MDIEKKKMIIPISNMSLASCWQTAFTSLQEERKSEYLIRIRVFDGQILTIFQTLQHTTFWKQISTLRYASI